MARAKKDSRQPEVLKEYVLRDMETGLFASGTRCDGKIKWTSRGKRFKRLNHLTLHLRYVEEPIKPTWEVIEYELVETSKFGVGVLIRDKSRMAWS